MTIDEIKADLRVRFAYHQTTGEQQARMHAIRQKCTELAELIAETTPQSREQSLAFTHLEDVMFNANAAISRREQQRAP